MIGSATGMGVFFDVVTAGGDPVDTVQGLGADEVRMLSDYLETLPNSGFPGFVRGLVSMRKVQLFDGDLESGFGEDYAPGATTAEGLDSGLRGEKL